MINKNRHQEMSFPDKNTVTISAPTHATRATRSPTTRSPARHLHRESARGVNRRSHLHPDVLRVFRHLESVPPERHRQTARSLQHGELIADALARAGAERDKREVAGHLVGVQTGDEVGVVPGPILDARVVERSLEPRRIELERLLPAVGVPVKVPHADEHVHALDEGHVRVARALGKGDVFQTSPDENGGLGVQPKRLRQTQPDQLHLLNLLVVRSRRRLPGRPHDVVDLRHHLSHQLAVLREAVQAPSQHSRGRLVARDEHRHEVVPELRIRHVRAPDVHQETQERRVRDLAVVAVLQLLQIIRALERLRLLDEAVEGLVDEVHVVLKLALPRDEDVRERQVPVRKVERRPVRRLLQARVHRLDDR
mmetsp:Transcript_11069/g.46135  ORF Transcript_11069/g.46135 Transcript_11069/m.46135 type:complete len:368 (-) Transcript_11069:850-1953(-)